MKRRRPAATRRERIGIALALAGVAVILAAFAATHVIVSSRLLRSWVNTSPEELLIDYESGTSWVPGIIQLRGLTIRGSDPNVQWWFRMDDARISVSLLDLLRKRFHATSVRAHGLVFRLREKKEKSEFFAPHQARVPAIPGFADPPLRTKENQQPAPPAVAKSGYWAVLVEGLVADPAPEIWIELYRFRGHARVTGSFLIRPHQEAWVGPAAVRFLSGDLTLGPEEPLLSEATGESTCAIEPYDPERVSGSEVWPHISGVTQIRGRLRDLAFVNYFLGRSKEPRLSSGGGAASYNVTFDHGIGRGEARFEARGVAARYSKGTLSGRVGGRLAITRWDMKSDVLDLSGTRIDMTEIVTSATAHDARDWWGHFEIPSGRLHGGLSGRTVIEARDARPLYTLFRADLPGWTQGILKLDGIKATASVRLASDLVEVRDLDARGGNYRIAGDYKEAKGRQEGAFLVETGPLAVALEIDTAASHVHLLGARKWFEEKRATRGRVPESPP